jgi:hypothetical protein
VNRIRLVAAAPEMSRKRPRRVVLLVIAVVCLAVLAGVLAARAFAYGIDNNYCNPCTLPASGAPAVSQAHHPSFYLTGMYVNTYTYYWESVYFYSANLNLPMCYVEAWVSGTYGVSTKPNCTTGPSDTDARCHVTHGSGPAPGSYCEAYYSGA